MTTYKWNFPQFDVANAVNGCTNVVKTIHWRLTAINGNVQEGAYGSVALDDPDPASFVQLADVTEDWAIAAVTAKLEPPLDKVKEALEAVIAQKMAPPVFPVVPPFAQAAQAPAS